MPLTGSARFEVERGERFAGGQTRSPCVLDATADTIGCLVLGKGCEEAGGGPFRPDRLNAGQTQLIEQQLDAGSIDGGRYAGHAASPRFEWADTMLTEAQLNIEVERRQLDGDTQNRGRLGSEAIAQCRKIG